MIVAYQTPVTKQYNFIKFGLVFVARPRQFALQTVRIGAIGIGGIGAIGIIGAIGTGNYVKTGEVTGNYGIHRSWKLLWGWGSPWAP